jgi:S-DNA-T family DNA segregation ATPase FtsK/SpoIIIE
VFERLPHTVGYVTNLSAELSRRALTSLRAELNRRMAIMEGRAKDLAEMLEVAPDEAPPSLVIIVDEFATLVKEVPEFVEGVIDIAQRGRSLGIHLVLATQRPSGSVNENILANTNLRISLRMLDRSESTSIIDSPAAADIPVPLRGRGLARLGPRQLVEFQSAFAGAPVVSDDARQPVLIAPFRSTDNSPRAVVAAPKAGEAMPVTHLSAIIDAVVGADTNAGHPAPRRPWREVLPDVITLDDVSSVPSGTGPRALPGRHVTIGLIDAPEQQDQRPGVIDLEEGGGLLVFGSGGAGKTTLLRTIAASLDQSDQAEPVATIVFDFASRGLVGLRGLPSVIDVATGDDLEAVTRHLTMLGAELERRRRLLADAGAEHLTAYHRDQSPLPRIVVLIDGFGGLSSTLLEPAGGLAMASEMWGELVNRLVIDGRQVGIHTVITADRRSAVPSRLHSAVANRLILRHADEGSYAEHGVPLVRARGLDLTPGRGLLQGETLIQVASVSSDPVGRAQGEAIAAMAAAATTASSIVLTSAALPDHVSLDLVPALPPGLDCGPAAAIGLVDVSGAAAVVDLDWSSFTVAGPPRSGRSTTLTTVASSLLDRHGDVFVVGPSSSPLAALDLPLAAFGRAAEVAPLLDQLATQLALGEPERRFVLIIDDVDTFDDPTLAPILDRLANYDSLRVVGSLESRAMAGYTTSPLVGLLRRARRLLVLQPDDPSEFLQATGVKLPARPGLRMPPGRGVLLTDRTPSIIQVGVVPVIAAGATPGSVTAARRPDGPDRPVAVPGAVAPSVSTREPVACDRRPAHT